MDLVTLKPWVYPTSTGEPVIYFPDDVVGRYSATPSPKQPGVYTPERLVENYDSLVWKEGFRSTGEFELKTHDIQATLDLLPKYTLVSLLDSNEVCVVLTHHIGTDEEDRDVLTVSGKSLLVYLLENRITASYTNVASGDDPNAVTTQYLSFQVPDHLAFLMYSSIVFPHSEGGYLNTKKRFELPFYIMVPHTAISQSVSQKGPIYRTKWPAPMESRLDSVSALLDLEQNYGVRVIRPNGMSASIYRPNTNSRFGEGGLTIEHNIDKMLFDVYQGVDRTLNNEDRVVFRYDSGDLESSEYLSSIDGSKNFVTVHAEINTETFPTTKPPYNYELLWVDDRPGDKFGYPMLGNVANRKYQHGLKFRHGETTTSANFKENGITNTEMARSYSDAFKYLKENADIDLLTADISPYTNYRFKEHYNLGDMVMVHGKYGAPQKMVVSEYTRTEEVSGEKGYPTMTKWEPSVGM